MSTSHAVQPFRFSLTPVFLTSDLQLLEALLRYLTLEMGDRGRTRPAADLLGDRLACRRPSSGTGADVCPPSDLCANQGLKVVEVGKREIAGIPAGRIDW